MSVNIKINDIDIKAEDNATVLEAAKSAGIKIPTLCFMENCNKLGACRICVVEVKGMKNPVPSCVTKVFEGMEVITESAVLLDARRRSMDLIFKHHNTKCEYCSRYSDCELHEVLRYLGMNEHPYEKGIKSDPDVSSHAIARDNTKCITCRRCVSTCFKIQGMNVLKVFNTAGQTYIGTDGTIAESNCTLCGQCLMSCPTGALSELDESFDVSFALRNKNGKKIVAVVADEAAKRVGELFYEKNMDKSEGKFASALKLIGFDVVYKKSDFVTEHFCPSVLRMARTKFPDIADDIYSMSAQKPYQAVKKMHKDDIVVAITPCIAEKGEDDIADFVLTTREAANLFKHQCVSRFTANEVWSELKEGNFDTAVEVNPSTNNNRNKIYGLKEVENALKEVISGEKELEKLELYACLNGCMYGGGQPRR